MSNIPKHDPEQKREQNNSKKPRVYLPVPRHTISVNDFLAKIKKKLKTLKNLKNASEIVCPEKCWGFH